jgi:uncharacterized membrane protein YdbT with pleckstrin-like domain
VLLIIIALSIATLAWQWPAWLAWISGVLLLWPLKRHLENRMTKITILEDKLRFDTGFLTKTTRTILVSRIQDITVSQRVRQRMLGVGDLSIETAGETSRLTIENIDSPQAFADEIHGLAHNASMNKT